MFGVRTARKQTRSVPLDFPLKPTAFPSRRSDGTSPDAANLQFVDLADFDYPFPAPWAIRPHLGRTPAAEIHMGAGVQD